MFPLSGSSYPASSAQLASAISSALGEVFSLPKGQQTVVASGGDWPRVDALTVDLDGAAVKSVEPPPKPMPAVTTAPGVTVGQLRFTGRPIRYGAGRLDAELTAERVQLDFGRDAAGRAMLVLRDAATGRAESRVSKADLQALALAAASAGAKQHGVAIQELRVDLSSAGPRSISASIRVKARKMMMSGVIQLLGRVDIDDALVATLSGLSCTGEGMVGAMAAGLVQGQLKSINGKQIPLMGVSLGAVKLRDLTLDASDGLHVVARFGSAPG